MALSEVQHDGAGLEQGETALFVGRNLPEGMEGEMRGSSFISPKETSRTS